MMKGIKCKAEGCKKDAVKYWITGSGLCEEHYNEWNEKAKMIREGKDGWF